MVERARRLGRWFLALDSLLVILGFFVVMPMISLRFVDQLGWAAGIVGLALGLRQLTQQGLGVLGGSLADKFGARPLIVGGMLLRAAGFASLAYAQSGLELILSCIISGLGGCLFDPPRAALVIKFTRPRQRGRYISLLMMLESADDVVLIAGKGHEPYQEIHGERLPFSDLEQAKRALAAWHAREKGQ